MDKFGKYFLMKCDDVREYAYEKLKDQFDWDKESMEAKEIGDGNLNYVFRVWDKNGNSVIIKHAGDTLRISSAMHASTDRNRIESEILILQDKLAPGMVPRIYFYDTVMCACAMEDLSDHEIMRTAMMKHEIFPHFAEEISSFMANTLMGTTDVVLDHKDKKELQKKYINPELCEITEDLVYTEPYNDNKGRNNVFPPNKDFVKKELYEDEELSVEVAKLKMDFMTRAQSLLHGDLHTGSIFINEKNTVVFEPEFCFYGPMGYDIGNVIANMMFAYANAKATMADGKEKDAFISWVEDVIVSVTDLTMAKMRAYYDEHATDVMAKNKKYEDYYLKSILSDTVAVIGLELNRRLVGMANVKDITTIKDEDKRAKAERYLILAAKEYIKKRDSFNSGKEILDTLKEKEGRV